MRILFLRMFCVALVCFALAVAFAADLHRQEVAVEKSSEKDAQLVTKHDTIASQDKIIEEQSRVIDEQGKLIDEQDNTIERLENIFSDAIGREYSGQPLYTMSVTATAYTAREEECNSQPWVTASGTPSRVGIIAVSRDIERAGIKLGDLVIIKDMGLFRVEDRMNKRWTKRIDILHANLEAARNFAKREVELMWMGRTQTAKQS